MKTGDARGDPGVVEQDWAATGVPGLDEILGGGLPAGRLYLLEGEAGTGKTTLALQFLLEGVRNGEECLYLTLSESRREIEIVAQAHGWDTDAFEILPLTLSEKELRADETYTLFPASEVEMDETVDRVVEAVEKRRPSRLALDSITELRLMERDPLRFRRRMFLLKEILADMGATTIAIDEVTAQGSTIYSLVHGVIVLECNPPAYGGDRRRLYLSKVRGLDFHGGYHDFRIRTGGLEVYPRVELASVPRTTTLEPLSSGVEGIDGLMGGGPDRGTATLLLGPAGSGKSTLAMQFVAAAAGRGESSSVFLFDEGRASFFARWDGIGLAPSVSEAVEQVEVQKLEPGDLSPGEFADSVRRAVEDDGARVVVIDSLSGYLHAMPEKQLLELQVHELADYLNGAGVATFLTLAQHGIVGSGVLTPADLSYLVDTVVLLRFFEFQGEMRRALSVVKKRSGKHERTIRELVIDGGLRVGEPLREFNGVLSGTPRFAGTAGQIIE